MTSGLSVDGFISLLLLESCLMAVLVVGVGYKSVCACHVFKTAVDA